MRLLHPPHRRAAGAGINGAQVSQSPIQWLLELADLTVTTAAGGQGYVGVDLALAGATALAAEVTREQLRARAALIRP